MRGSRSGELSHVHAVNTWACEAGIILAQAFVGDITGSETSYYISSLGDTRAEAMLAYIRGHWSMENRCNWMLDAICRKDHNQTRERNAAAKLATLPRMGLNAQNRMPAEGKKPKCLPKRGLRAAQGEAYLEQLLSLRRFSLLSLGLAGSCHVLS